MECGNDGGLHEIDRGSRAHARSGTVKADVKVAWPRPRDLLRVELFEAQKRVLGELR